ncbi:Ger(x)C family spore germination protein [Bacillus tianshenii]|uniref:Ger(x)C family spore germination protein n=1 Tax=Sutcliffiella tianshenii TaxID=1463404 RepID=UPI001CD54D6F|nr:Ger(x)C family spore germination protein [Bacillus tianshenii]MCA1319293.1 Ger(x)C family spore germination protein [Bacillus tianshenii]
MSRLRRLSVTLIMIFCLLLLTSCWDQRLLKDLKLVFTVGFDKGENDEILSTIAIRESKKVSIGGEPGEATVAVVKASGITLRDTRLQLDRKIPGEFSPSKMRVYLIGENLAKEDLYSILDILYRDPRAPLGAKLAITKSDASRVIEMGTIKETLLTEAVTDLLENGEENTIIANETVQTICPIMFDPSSDFVLPVIERIEPHDIQISGIGLISDKVFTGDILPPHDATILLLMAGHKGKKTQMVLKVHKDEKIVRNQYMTLNINKSKRTITIQADSPESIKAEVHLELSTSIAEYPKNSPLDKQKVDKLAEKAAAIIEENSIPIIETIQGANSDVLKIGEEIRVHHHSIWEELKWRETYPNIKIIPKVSVKITGTGIIN